MKVFKNSKPDAFVLALAAAWVIVVVVAVFVMVTNRMVTFDERLSIFERFHTVTNYLDAFSVELPKSMQETPTVIRITEKKCNCNIASEAHWALLKKTYPAYQFIELNLKDLTKELKSLIPSTPMALIIQTPNKVTYAGPFSNSNYCNADNSLIEAYLSYKATQPYSPLETQGCYCENSKY